jgi:hypothetical protein
MAFEASPQRAVGRSCVVVTSRQWRTGGASERKKLVEAGETVVRRESVALSQ